MTLHHVEETTLSLQWYIPNRVLYIVARGSLTNADSLYANDRFAHYLSQCTDPVHFIIDVSNVRKLSTKLFHIQPYVMRHEMLGWVVTVGMQQNPIVDFGISALSPKIRIRHHDCASLQDGLAFLRATDPDLPDLNTVHIS